jgi:hypothetical protein
VPWIVVFITPGLLCLSRKRVMYTIILVFKMWALSLGVTNIQPQYATISRERKFDRLLLILRWWFEIMIAFNPDHFLYYICHWKYISKAKIWWRLVIIFIFDNARHTLQNCSPFYRTNNVGKIGSTPPEMNLVFRLDKSYILNNCNNAIIYDFTPAYLKPPLQIRVLHLHKYMSPNVTGDTVIMERYGSASEIHVHCRTLWSVVNCWIRYNDLCCKLCNISVLVNQCIRPSCTLGGSTYPKKKKTNKPRALTI